jgi:hypothetical protein
VLRAKIVARRYRDRIRSRGGEINAECSLICRNTSGVLKGYSGKPSIIG